MLWGVEARGGERTRKERTAHNFQDWAATKGNGDITPSGIESEEILARLTKNLDPEKSLLRIYAAGQWTFGHLQPLEGYYTQPYYDGGYYGGKDGKYYASDYAKSNVLPIMWWNHGKIVAADGKVDFEMFFEKIMFGLLTYLIDMASSQA